MRALELRPMSAGEVLDRAFQVYRAHFLPFFLTAFVVFVPMGLLYAALGFSPATDPGAGETAVLLLMFVLMVGVSVLSWAALTWEVEWGVAGEPVSVGRGYRAALRVAPRLMLLWVLLYVLLTVAMFAAVLPGALIAGLAAVLPGLAGVVGAFIGLVFMIAVFLLGLVWWGAVAATASPVLILEDRGVVESIKRGRALSKGARLRVGGLMALAWLIVMLPTFGALVLVGLFTAVWDPAAAAQLSSTELYVQQLVVFGIGSLTTPYMVAVMVMVYYDRRIRREGYDVEVASRDLPV